MAIVKILQEIKQYEFIEVTFPYFYEYDISGNYHNTTYFGIVTDKTHTTIQTTTHDLSGDINVEVEASEHVSLEYSGLSECFKPEHKSSAERYAQAKKVILSIINKIP